MIRPIVLCACLAVAGCATTQTTAVTDTFCITAKKRTWSINDTAESIRDTEVWNKTIDLRCGVRGKKA
jgi:hypothetical protein